MAGTGGDHDRGNSFEGGECKGGGGGECEGGGGGEGGGGEEGEVEGGEVGGGGEEGEGGEGGGEGGGGEEEEEERRWKRGVVMWMSLFIIAIVVEIKREGMMRTCCY